MIIVTTSNFFASKLKRKVVDFKFLRFEERFRKAPFSWRISVDGRPNRRVKVAFQISPAYCQVSIVDAA